MNGQFPIAAERLQHREPLKTFTEISEMLGVSPNTLKRLIHNGPSPKIHRPRRYYSPTEVIRWWNGIASSVEIPVRAIKVKPATTVKNKTSGFAVGVSIENYQWISTTAQALGKSKQKFVDEMVQGYIKTVLAS